MPRSTQQLQSSQTQLLRQLRKQLEYPKILDSWNATGMDLCFLPPDPLASLSCDGNSVAELKIVGDRTARPLADDDFDGRPIPGRTLSDGFSVDSFVTTLARLSSLKVLILVSLGIWGPLPDKIHRLYSLQVLDLSSNFLFGAVPPRLSAMAQLHTLSLDANYFNATVPDWLDRLPGLAVLSLQRNRLRGPLPDSIGRSASLTDLSLSGNRISGRMPGLAGLSRLEVLDARDNELDSELPALPRGLVTVLLSNNSFRGAIPRQLGELRRLQHLDLSFNLLEGTPPEALFSLPNVSYLNLESNMLSGSLPGGMACSGQLGFVDLSNNRLSGALPSCLSSNSSKRAVKFAGNCLANDPQHQQHDPKYCEAGGAGGEGSRNRDMGLMVAVIGGIIVVSLSVLLAFVIMCRRKLQRAMAGQRLLSKPLPDNSASGFSSELLMSARYISQAVKLGTQVLPTYRVFSLEELREATKDFDKSSYLGEGSVGKLYKGRLENGIFVAIRCLELYKRYSIRNLKLRLDLLSKLRHSHLVCLLGHCIDAASNDSDVNMVFLIYEYVPNGNLRAHLFEHSPERVLKWSDRLAVLTGIAKAVHFLHTGIIPGFFNNRLTSNNILLDEHRIVKVSDYGLSIISEEIYKNEGREEGQKTVRSISPNLKTKDLEDDVYAFGLIILEALVGPSISEKGEEFFLNVLAKPCGALEERKGIIDRNVLSTCSQESLSIVLDIMDKCLLPDPSARPSIEDVLWNLQYATQVQTTADGDQRSDLGSQT